MTSKYASEYPLPGSVDQYFNSHRLTPEGSSLLEKVESDDDAARRTLMEMKFQTIAGYEEMLRFLSEGTRTFDEIDSALKSALQAGWKSKNQTAFRLSWLRSPGYAEKGRRGHRRSEPREGRPLRSTIRDRLPA
jgi:hypothetical protein